MYSRGVTAVYADDTVESSSSGRASAAIISARQWLPREERYARSSLAAVRESSCWGRARDSDRQPERSAVGT